MKTIAVLGSNSFSGSHFVDYCLSIGHPVLCISRSQEPSNAFLPYKSNDSCSNVVFYKLDLNNDIDCILDIFDSHKPSYVVNFSAQGMVSESWVSPVDWYKTNFIAPALLTEELKNRSYLKKYLQVSTPEVYGNCNDLLEENTIYKPTTPYAVSKAAIDMSLMSYFKNYNYPVVWTRSANVYGPGQQLYRIIPRAILSIMRGVTLPLHGGGSPLRSFIHIDDVVRGTYLVMESGNPGEIYHLSTQSLISIKDLVCLICDKMNVRFNDIVSIVSDRKTQDQIYNLSSRKMRDELNWHISTDLIHGIDSVITWAKENYNELSLLDMNYQHKQ